MVVGDNMVTIDDVKNSLNENKNITKEIKANIFELVLVFNNKYPNVSLDRLNEKLKTIKIIKGSKFVNPRISEYNMRENAIYFNISEIEKGYDIVIGSRFVEKKKPFSARMMGSRMISLAIKITTGKRINDPTSGMRLYDRKCMREYAQEVNYGPEPDTISYLIKNGAKISEIQVDMEERIAGTSYLNFAKSISYMFRMLMSIMVIQLFRKR